MAVWKATVRISFAARRLQGTLQRWPQAYFWLAALAVDRFGAFDGVALAGRQSILQEDISGVPPPHVFTPNSTYPSPGMMRPRVLHRDAVAAW